MSNIQKHRPYIYMGKTNTDYHIALAMLAEVRETVTLSRAGKIITCTIGTGAGTNTNLEFKLLRETVAIPSPDFGATEALEIVIVIDDRPIARDYCLPVFGNADPLSQAPANTDPMPLLLVMVQGQDPLECKPSAVILPDNGLKIAEETLTRTAAGVLSYNVTVTAGNGNLVHEGFVINNIFLTDPLPADYSEVEMRSGGDKPKKVKIPQKGVPMTG